MARVRPRAALFFWGWGSGAVPSGLNFLVLGLLSGSGTAPGGVSFLDGWLARVLPRVASVFSGWLGWAWLGWGVWDLADFSGNLPEVSGLGLGTSAAKPPLKATKTN